MLKNVYSASELESIVNSVKWAVENEHYDFSSLLPDLKHANKEIYQYLCVLQKSLTKL